MLSFTLKLYFKFRHELLKRSIENPEVSQQKELALILEEVSTTSFGKDHGLMARDTYESFSKKVKISTYEEIYPYIKRMLDGEANVLWHGVVRMFSKSSGTTNAKSKYIPVSAESLRDCHLGGTEAMVTFYTNAYPDTKIFEGKTIGITGSIEEEGGIERGDVSALIRNRSPFWTEFKFVPDKETALLPDWNEKSSIIVENCSTEDVTMLAGVPTWILIILEKMKKKNGEDFWPNLELISHGGVNFEPYKKLFETYLPNRKINYWQSYNASEGFFATQDRKEVSDMLLLVSNGVFYEFVPVTDYQKGNYENIIPLSKVSKDIDYALIITTNSGLMRYSIGDTVKFTSLAPYRIVVTGRTKFFLNAFGEEVVVENVETAISYAQEKTNSVMKYYTVAPIYMNANSSGYHIWYIEFTKEPSYIEDFTQALDEKLKEINSDYEAKRRGDTILGAPKVKVLPSGSFEKWLKKKNKFGGQNKIPPLSTDTSIIDELDGILEDK